MINFLFRKTVRLAIVAVPVVSALTVTARRADAAGPRPNILWISTEDISPDLGCYGDAYAETPNLDRLASQGALYSRAFSVAGVCAPSRSAIITGMYPTTIGTHHMRCMGVPPAYVKCFTEYLRAAGYYCSNNVKTDYNFDRPLTAWDENSRTAHWRDRADGQPFFSVINITMTHESRIRAPASQFSRLTRDLLPQDRHDPAQAVLPPYYPDTPIVRRDWARYYDLITAMDRRVAAILEQLEADGLAENTVVFFFGDHGRGLPRGKRWIYDSGLRIPLIVRWPGKIEPGTVNGELVSFIDFGPTVLSLAGVKIPDYIQGRAFLGDAAGPPRDYIFGARDRMDEAYDIIRCVRDKRYKYIRNFEPGKPYAQYIDYMEKMPTLQEWRRLHKAGKLVGPQRNFFLPRKPEEELYDTQADPHEVNNLAQAPGHQEIRQRLRARLERHMTETNDLGLIPEAELNEQRRLGGKWAVTADPVITTQGGRVAITCETEGASIAYTTEPGRDAHWKLYVKPIKLAENDKLRAKACRLGYRNSNERNFRE
jgi:uncharacterized sulfatase